MLTCDKAPPDTSVKLIALYCSPGSACYTRTNNTSLSHSSQNEDTHESPNASKTALKIPKLPPTERSNADGSEDNAPAGNRKAKKDKKVLSTCPKIKQISFPNSGKRCVSLTENEETEGAWRQRRKSYNHHPSRSRGFRASVVCERTTAATAVTWSATRSATAAARAAASAATRSAAAAKAHHRNRAGAQ